MSPAARIAVAVAWSALSLGATLTAQATWQAAGGPLTAVARAAETAAATVTPKAPAVLPAGAFDVHFPVGTAGKPLSLSLSVADGDQVVVATAAGPGGGGAAAAPRELSPNAETWSETTAPGVAPEQPVLQRTLALDGGDHRVEVAVGAVPDGAALGVVARARGATDLYRCVWSPGDRTLRLERVLGGDALLLRSVAAPGADAAPHRLALQAEGFRLQVWLDDALLLQALDGALSGGAFGWCWRGAAPEVTRVTASPPIAARPSAALVQSRTAATLQAAVTVSPGHLYLLELSRDWPYPALPLDAGGFEPWVLQRPATPQIALADWRGSLGERTFGEVPADGRFDCALRWPALPALRHRVALVKALLVAPSGDVLVGATPAVRVVF